MEFGSVFRKIAFERLLQSSLQSLIVLSEILDHNAPLGSQANPIVISQDFDKETLEFINNEESLSNKPSNVAEVSYTRSPSKEN